MTYSQVIYEGLWKNNPSLVQLLGLCPLLAVSGTVVNALGLGIATMIILAVCNMTISLIREIIPNEVRLPVFMIVIASFVTAIEMLIKAFYYELYMILGIFIPLIVTNCIVIGRAEAFASRQSVGLAALDGLMMGLGMTFALVVLAAFREVLGYGTLFSQAELMFGQNAQWMTVTVISDYQGFLLAVLPPGAFIGLGLLVAGKKALDRYFANRVTQQIVVMPPDSQTTT